MSYTEFASGFDPITDTWLAVTYQAGRLVLAMAYVSLVLLAVKRGLAPRLLHALAAVGRMALTNYLGTSIVCTLLFNGYGLGFFGSLDRYQLYFVVLAVWLAQLLLSPLWLHGFQFGPVEWLWRSLTYARLQTLRREPTKLESLVT